MTQPESSTYTYGGQAKLDLDQQLDHALKVCNGDERAAAALFIRWSQANSEIADLIPDILTDHIRRRVKTRAKQNQEK